MATGALVFNSRDEELEWLNRASPTPKLKKHIFRDRDEELEWLNRAIPKKDFRPKTR